MSGEQRGGSERGGEYYQNPSWETPKKLIKKEITLKFSLY